MKDMEISQSRSGCCATCPNTWPMARGMRPACSSTTRLRMPWHHHHHHHGHQDTHNRENRHNVRHAAAPSYHCVGLARACLAVRQNRAVETIHHIGNDGPSHLVVHRVLRQQTPVSARRHRHTRRAIAPAWWSEETRGRSRTRDASSVSSNNAMAVSCSSAQHPCCVCVGTAPSRPETAAPAVGWPCGAESPQPVDPAHLGHALGLLPPETAVGNGRTPSRGQLVP